MRPDETSWSLESLPGEVSRLVAEGCLFLGSLAEKEGEEIFLRYLFFRPGQKEIRSLACPLPPGVRTVPSLVPVLPALHWDEREIQDLFGVRFPGHPDPRPLLLPDGWTGPAPFSGEAPAEKRIPWAPRLVKGKGLVHIPVGPVHAGIIESGHFSFSTVGETVLALDARLSWNHRGIEKDLEGRELPDALRIIERTCGTCTASHQAAFAQAAEALAGISPSPRMDALRLVLLEMERLTNHLNDLAQMATGIALQVLFHEGMALKERLLRLQDEHFGHRYLFGSITPGGVREPHDARLLLGALTLLQADVLSFTDRLFRHPSFPDRLGGIGLVSKEAALELGAVGPSARASGIPRDIRVDLPYGAYRGRSLAPALRTAGDALARAEIRLEEISQTFSLLLDVLNALPPGATAAAFPALPDGRAVGLVESPRGSNLHYLHAAKGKVARYHIRSAAFANWPLVMVAAMDSVVGDFPLINKSFELCYACADR